MLFWCYLAQWLDKVFVEMNTREIISQSRAGIFLHTHYTPPPCPSGVRSVLFLDPVSCRVSRFNMASLKDLCAGLPVESLPPPKQRDNSVPHAPVRTTNLTLDEERVSSLPSKVVRTRKLNLKQRVIKFKRWQSFPQRFWIRAIMCGFLS